MNKTIQLLAAALCAALPASAAAQTSERGPGAVPKATSGPAKWVSLLDHSERLSRQAFTACDANRDDRLSVLEASRTIEGVSHDDLDSFRRMDRSSDGFVHWPEFDQRFRELTSRGNPMRIRPYRPLPAPPVTSLTAGRTNTPMAQAVTLIAQFDADKDGNLGLDEVAKGLQALGAPTDLLLILGALDLDKSQDLTPHELLPFVAQLPPIQAAPRPTQRGASSGLPTGYRKADTNKDGVLDRAEVENVLRSIDSILPRWASQIVRDADRSGNNTLGPQEIRRAGPSRRD